ncbi:hypothetical protein SBOR_8052 [Sclerotinia borealis F-4128]|uniref:Uncharacterized protein n=1 Tax=Sclerotinia borealis (strain F-4128) TaxID=1432307 RepID=W9C6R6_SCLBF|nr:hypothetical protein SBOR_8052 [Sclerotinia borealis F-4128]
MLRITRWGYRSGFKDWEVISWSILGVDDDTPSPHEKDNSYTRKVNLFWQECLEHANIDALHESSETALTLFDYIDRIYHLSQPKFQVQGVSGAHQPNSLRHVSRTTLRCAMLFVSMKLVEDPTYFYDEKFSMRLTLDQSPWTDCHLNIVTEFLEMRASLHDKEFVAVAWQRLLKRMSTVFFDENNDDFMKAIEYSLFPRFLKYGASKTMHMEYTPVEPDVHAYIQREECNIYLYPCTIFLLALFYNYNTLNQTSLKMFVNVVEFLCTSSEEIRLQLENLYRPVLLYHQLRHYYRRQAESSDTTIGSVRVRFLARIAQILITKAIEIKLEMVELEKLVPAILAFFPSAVGENLANQIRTMNKDGELSTSPDQRDGRVEVCHCKRIKRDELMDEET